MLAVLLRALNHDGLAITANCVKAFFVCLFVLHAAGVDPATIELGPTQRIYGRFDQNDALSLQVQLSSVFCPHFIVPSLEAVLS